MGMWCHIHKTSFFHTLDIDVDLNTNSLGPMALLLTNKIASIWNVFGLEPYSKIILGFRTHMRET